ncbi:MAG: LPS export ABC transporter periplasmic protein LptC [Deltaproteobacteria bacterium]|nr:LPS export ABC transporter periplasmic protein LptC [Deltaproteobacteria bacterium]
MILDRKKLIATGAVFLVALLTVCLAYYLNNRKASQGTALKIAPDRVDVEVKDVFYTEISDSDVKWEIRADSASYQKKENLAVFNNIAVRLLTKDGKVLMTGDHGEFDTNKKDIRIYGNVDIMTERGDRLRTDHLNYSHGDRRISTDAVVTMENPRMRVSGKGMTMSLDDRELRLLSNIKASVK